MSVKDFVQQRRDALIAMRRDFHMYPEPAWLEYRSAAKVADRLIRRRCTRFRFSYGLA